MLIGYVAQDPNIYTNDEDRATVGRFSISVEERLWSKEEGKRVPTKNWYDVVAFGGLASVVQSIVKAGRSVSVVGRLDIGEYEKDGVTMKSVQVQAEDLSITNWGSNQAEDQNEAPASEDVDEDEFPF
jgi:single-strand DNA-binding protein